MTEHDPVERRPAERRPAGRPPCRAGIVGSDWPEQAAVDLLVQHRRLVVLASSCARPSRRPWLDGELCAWVAWPYVDLNAPASSGELRILAIARSLGGVASERSLGDLLTSLDETNTARVLRAVSIACGGRRHASTAASVERRGGGVMTGAAQGS